MWYIHIIHHKKEWITNLWDNMNVPWKHYAYWKKPDHTLYAGHILFDTIYVKYPEQANPWRQKVD